MLKSSRHAELDSASQLYTEWRSRISDGYASVQPLAHPTSCRVKFGMTQ
ncbi:MAG: hypothetical protein IKQ61_08625 [Spirochaetales bacterium]|nr:hypothetical protein [Spirochaetales bacterium]MBR6060644.1 hypothetical protein [Spirochaetales bacterium]MBR6200311.1 hypothetical protein [Spirochaetales bacterium]